MKAYEIQIGDLFKGEEIMHAAPAKDNPHVRYFRTIESGGHYRGQYEDVDDVVRPVKMLHVAFALSGEDAREVVMHWRSMVGGDICERFITACEEAMGL